MNKEKKILIVGDMMLDRFVRGKVSRISPEAPVPVLEVTHTETHLGGAANVARNVAALKVEVDVIGRIGEDLNAGEFLALLNEEGIGSDHMLKSTSAQTSTKTRVAAGQHQIVRFDEEQLDSLSEEDEYWVCEKLKKIIDFYDVIIVEDYAKGFITNGVINCLRDLAASGARIIVDPNSRHLADWTGFTLVKPNWGEACAYTGHNHRNESKADVEQVARSLKKNWGCESILLTMGSKGMCHIDMQNEISWIRAEAKDVFDVSGAGDTAIGVYAVAISNGFSSLEASQLANKAASIVVGRLGTASIELSDLEEL